MCTQRRQTSQTEDQRVWAEVSRPFRLVPMSPAALLMPALMVSENLPERLGCEQSHCGPSDGALPKSAGPQQGLCGRAVRRSCRRRCVALGTSWPLHYLLQREGACVGVRRLKPLCHRYEVPVTGPFGLACGTFAAHYSHRQATTLPVPRKQTSLPRPCTPKP